MIQFNQSYKDICTEIDVLEIQVSDLELEMKFLRKRMYDNAPKFNGVVQYDAERVTGGQLPMSLDKVCERLIQIEDKLNIVNEILKAKKDARVKIEAILDNQPFDALEAKVAFMRDIKKMKLKDIASELDYSYDYIREVSARLK